MELRDDALSLSRLPSTLDEAVLEFTSVLDSGEGVEYVIVSGYVVILTGRSRATEDIDVLLESLTESEIEELVSAFIDQDYRGLALPLDEMYAMLSEGDRIRIAKEGELYPNFEVWFTSNAISRTAIRNALTAVLGDDQLKISPIELRIAYKLRLAKRTGGPGGKDFEDALPVYLTFGERWKADAFERYIDDYGVQDCYDELERVSRRLETKRRAAPSVRQVVSRVRSYQ